MNAWNWCLHKRLKQFLKFLKQRYGFIWQLLLPRDHHRIRSISVAQVHPAVSETGVTSLQNLHPDTREPPLISSSTTRRKGRRSSALSLRMSWRDLRPLYTVYRTLRICFTRGQWRTFKAAPHWESVPCVSAHSHSNPGPGFGQRPFFFRLAPVQTRRYIASHHIYSVQVAVQQRETERERDRQIEERGGRGRGYKEKKHYTGEQYLLVSLNDDPTHRWK